MTERKLEVMNTGVYTEVAERYRDLVKSNREIAASGMREQADNAVGTAPVVMSEWLWTVTQRMAQVEAVERALADFEWALAYLQDMPTVVARILARGADDEWSGRDNDLKRVHHDQYRSTLITLMDAHREETRRAESRATLLSKQEAAR